MRCVACDAIIAEIIYKRLPNGKYEESLLCRHCLDATYDNPNELITKQELEFSDYLYTAKSINYD